MFTQPRPNRTISFLWEDGYLVRYTRALGTLFEQLALHLAQQPQTWLMRGIHLEFLRDLSALKVKKAYTRHARIIMREISGHIIA
jgi:hypothetical protein